MVFGSSGEGSWGRLSSVCAPDVFSDQWMLSTPEIYLGREKGTIIFPEDVFISALIAKSPRAATAISLKTSAVPMVRTFEPTETFQLVMVISYSLGNSSFGSECKD